MKEKDLSTREKAAITRDLFERYRQGKTSENENEIIESLEKDFIPQKDFEVTDKLIDELDAETKDFIFRKISTPKKYTLSPLLIGSVASVALLLIGMYVLFYSRHQSTELTTKQHITTDTSKNLTLSDGSTITLNSGTTLREAAREVWLDEGEAFFDIQPDKKPFVVHLRNGLIVQVLGTSFTIQSYAELPFQEISVLSGKVSVKTSAGKAVELAPNQQATYNGTKLSTENVNGTQKASWRTGTVVLENATLQELSFRIRQLYGKRVVFDEKIDAISINITLSKDMTPDDIAAEIATLYALSYQIGASEIIFRPK